MDLEHPVQPCKRKEQPGFPSMQNQSWETGQQKYLMKEQNKAHTLREKYQKEMEDFLKESYRAGGKRNKVAYFGANTGSGKTYLACRLLDLPGSPASEKQQHALYMLFHTKEQCRAAERHIEVLNEF